MSHTHKTSAAELLEDVICPTSLSADTARLHVGVSDTKTDAHFPASNQQPKEIK
jgi:hypothetical protein